MKKKYTHIINKAVLTAIIECGGSQTKLASKLGMNRSYIAKSLNQYLNSNGVIFPTFLLGEFKKVFPKIPIIEYTQIVTVHSETKSFCKKLIADFIQKGKTTYRIRQYVEKA